ITLTSGELLIARNLTVQGPGAGILTISGNGASRVFEVRAAVNLSGMTISKGGAGILNHGTLTLSNCTVSNNRGSDAGGGIYSDTGGIVTIKNASSVTGNSILGNPSNSPEDVNNLGVLYRDSSSTIGALVGNAAIPI